MATTHYNFPTITGTDTIDGVNAINGLANAVDAALYGVAGDVPEQYKLPIAGTTSLGGVRGAGQISVNPSTGDMTIGNNTIRNSMLQAQCVTGSNIQSGTINTTQLSGSVNTQLSNGSLAYTSITAPPTLTTAPNYSAQGNMTSGTIYSNYVVNEAAHMVSIKVSGTGCVFNLPASNTDASNMLAQLFTLPSNYRPSSVYSQLMHVRSGSDGQTINFFVTVGANGNVGLTHVNYSGDRNGISFWGEGVITFFYGAQPSA